MWLRTAPGSPTVYASATFDAAHALVVIMTSALPGICFLLSPDLRDLSIEGGIAGRLMMSLRVARAEAVDGIRLRLPLGNSGCLTACSQQSTVPSSELRFMHGGDHQDTVFALSLLRETQVPSALLQTGAEIEQAISAGLRAEPLLALFESGALLSAFAEPLILVMPSDELAELARLVLVHPSHLTTLQRAFPDDFWLQGVFPRLIAWEDQRPEVSSHHLESPATDEPYLLPAMGLAPLQAGVVLQSLARRTLLPRRNACIVATAKDEGPYLLDWLSYHLSIGFEHIFIYTNDNTDGSEVLLRELARHGVITLIENERGGLVGPQLKAYTHALTILPQTLDFRWTAVLDIDEYLGFDARRFDSVADFTALQEEYPVDAIALCWLIFCARPSDLWSGQSSLERFTRREPGVNAHVKSLFRTRLFWHTQPHFPTATLDSSFMFRNEHRTIHHHPGEVDRVAAYAKHPSADIAWINHYFLRTADEALWKWRRGRADWLGGDVGSQHTEFRDFVCGAFLSLARPDYQVEDRRILACCGKQGRELTRLLELPGVAETDRQLKAEFSELLANNTAAFLSTPLTTEAPDSLRHFREMIEAVRS